MEFFKGLNPSQQQAIKAGMGPVLVLAGPGSGKTRVLTQRIAYLIGHLGVRPYHIMAVTFTNKAAREMKNRVDVLLGLQAQGLMLGTFHAICARILRRESAHLPIEANFVIFDSDDQVSLVKRAIQDLNIDEKRYRPHSIHASISNAKNELYLPEDFPVQNYRDEVVRRVYERYQGLLLASNGVDFDDLLLWTAHLLEGVPEVREKYARLYEHVLVDEFQDTNMAQYVLLKHLASNHRNIFVVGDVDQSIYRWRGADYRNVLRFEEDFPDAQIILLEQNYRSTQSILDVAMAVIDRNPHRTTKRLFTERGEGIKVLLHEAYDDREEARFVVDTIAKLVARQKTQPGDFAIMYRTNAQSRVLEEAFLHANLPYKLVGAQRFYGRREIKDIISFLRVVQNPGDEISLLRVLNLPPRGIGTKTVIALRTYAQKVSLNLGELLLELGQGRDPTELKSRAGRTVAAVVDFGQLLCGWIKARQELSPLALIDRILADVDYREYIDDGTEEGQERWENVMELRRLAAEYEQQNLENFLEDVALVSDQDTLDETANAPTLLTLHAAKGLEFPVVFIVGLNDGVLPHMRSFDDPEGMEEERRLFYVGITRAKDRLYLINPLNRSAYGYNEPTLESRFLEDIPLKLLEGSVPGKPSRRTGSHRVDQWGTLAGAERAVQPQYSPGERVHHPVWGEGMVLNSRIQDDDEIVDIFFEELGLKRVAASLAKLQVKREP
jgi:DNA helicase II / ATP-dependent DNA helicase PcrA